MQSNFAFVPFKAKDPLGYLIYLRDRILVAQAFDSARLRTLGEPYALGPAVAATPVIGAAVETGDFAATQSTLVYRSGGSVSVIRNWMP